MGKAKPPPQNKELEETQLRALQLQIQQAKQGFHMPEIPQPKLLPQAPPPPGGPDADYAAAAQRKKAAGRLSPGRATLLAGETGGYKPASTLLA